MGDENMRILVTYLERLETRQNRMEDQLDTIDKTLARLTATVEVHEKRSTALETIVASCRTQCDAKINTVESLAEQIENSVNKVFLAIKWTGMLAGGVGAGIGIVVGVLEIMEKIK